MGFCHRVFLFISTLIIATQPAHAGFFGPDVELLAPPQVAERLLAEPLVFGKAGKALEIRTKGAAVGGFLVGMILSSAMASGGGGGATNAAQMQRQMQANMDIAQQANVHIQGAVNQLSAEAAGAAAAELAQRGPLPLLAQSLDHALRGHQAQLVAADAEPKPSLVLSLRQTEWKLDFETFSSDYVLKTALTLELLDKRADKLHLRATCQQEYPKKMELDDWERDNHLAIAQAAEEIARGCHDEFAKALNIALADPPAPATTPLAMPEAAAIAATAPADAPSGKESSSDGPAQASN
ncbi:MAG: hypothetical protein WC023_15600 [Rhodocyclaceae bacterium]